MLAVENIDAEIETIKSRIQTLEKDRRLYVQKSQGVSRLREELDGLLGKYALSEREYLTVISDRIVDFIRSGEPKPGEAAPRYWTELAGYFEQAGGRHAKPTGKQKAPRIKTDAAEAPVLKAGRYYNPHTGITLQKIRRPTREFQEWINEYGVEAVAKWKVA